MDRKKGNIKWVFATEGYNSGDQRCLYGGQQHRWKYLLLEAIAYGEISA
ncbi:MAG TPA: hypothetical protein VJ184_15205 [Chryseolinea sp.]|nr:hypothetical protein [Chryseolinea sp.]